MYELYEQTVRGGLKNVGMAGPEGGDSWHRPVISMFHPTRSVMCPALYNSFTDDLVDGAQSILSKFAQDTKPC